MAGTDADGDERPYAQALAVQLRRDLTERLYDQEAINLAQPISRTLPRPTSWPFLSALDKVATALSSDYGCTATMRGSGGDALFCDLRNAGPVADRMLISGVGIDLILSTLALARVTGTGVARILWLAFRKAMQPRRHRWKADTSFLTPPAAAAIEHVPSHPWLDPPAGALPGKLDHVAAILRVQSFLEVHDVGVDVIAALYNQPIMELCLAIPTYRWIEGGLNRAVARAAFADRLPAAVLRRTLKGGPDGFAHTLLETRRAQVLSMLLDGYLVNENIIDRDAIDCALRPPFINQGPTCLRLLALADVEAWCRMWSGRQYPAATIPA